MTVEIKGVTYLRPVGHDRSCGLWRARAGGVMEGISMDGFFTGGRPDGGEGFGPLHCAASGKTV